MAASASVPAPVSTLAATLWPAGGSRTLRWLRNGALVVGGAALLTLSAKVQVPGPIPMSLSTLAVLALAATLGTSRALGALALYLAEGLMGAPVFVNTPPLVPGPAYFVGPTGGFLLGFVVATVLLGLAADRGWARRPLAFPAAVLLADAAILGCGFVWLALFATVGGGTGLGWSRAFAAGVAPFLLGEAVKVALASVAVPALLDLSLRLRRR